MPAHAGVGPGHRRHLRPAGHRDDARRSDDLAGAASGVNNTIRQVGSVVGSAAVGALLQNRLASHIQDEAVLGRKRCRPMSGPSSVPVQRAAPGAGSMSGRHAAMPGGLPAGSWSRSSTCRRRRFPARLRSRRAPHPGSADRGDAGRGRLLPAGRAAHDRPASRCPDLQTDHRGRGQPLADLRSAPERSLGAPSEEETPRSSWVELRGLEPLTPSMPWRCATSCATAPCWPPPERGRQYSDRLRRRQIIGLATPSLLVAQHGLGSGRRCARSTASTRSAVLLQHRPAAVGQPARSTDHVLHRHASRVPRAARAGAAVA